MPGLVRARILLLQKFVLSCVGSSVFLKLETAGRKGHGWGLSYSPVHRPNKPQTCSLCIVAFAKALTSQIVSAAVVLEKASKQGCPKSLNSNALFSEMTKMIRGVAGQFFVFAHRCRDMVANCHCPTIVYFPMLGLPLCYGILWDNLRCKFHSGPIFFTGAAPHWT